MVNIELPVKPRKYLYPDPDPAARSTLIRIILEILRVES